MTIQKLQDLFEFSQTLKFEEVKCPLCGDGRFSDKVRLPGYHIVRCQKCGFCYENPRPQNTEIPKLYQTQYFQYLDEHAQANLDIALLNLRDIAFDEFERSLNSQKRLLDVGCEKGTFLKYMRNRGWDVYGVEIGDAAYDHAKNVERLNVFQGELPAAKYPAGHFDVVHLSHVIEHMGDPFRVLKESHRILRKGGIAIVITDNFNSLARIVFQQRWRGLVPIHLVFFSQKTLRQTLTDIGFEVTHMVSWGGIDKGSAPSWLKKIFDRLTKKLNIGDVMLFCAKKI
jgi:2-polyprenyl-3-methyl-5-hydroxy-6-metoxy-1,4-benzoquinol methylase